MCDDQIPTLFVGLLLVALRLLASRRGSAGASESASESVTIELIIELTGNRRTPRRSHGRWPPLCQAARSQPSEKRGA
eukprot:531792-Prymnesium_polylepis.2